MSFPYGNSASCMDGYSICKEPQILPLVLKEKKGFGPGLKTSDCIRCDRCIDVCEQDVFEYRINTTALDVAARD